MFTGSFIDVLIVHWTKLFRIDVIYYYTKIKQAKETQLYFSLLNFIKFNTWENIFNVDRARSTYITAYPNMVTKSQRYMQNHVISKKKMN